MLKNSVTHQSSIACLGLLFFPLLALAAPLDALLDAKSNVTKGNVRIELAADAVNETLDVFKLRSADPTYSGTNVGDYRGGHLDVGYAITDRLFAAAGAWNRTIFYRTDEAKLNSWQLATQFRLFGDGNSDGAMAVRVSAWGDSADHMIKSSPTDVSGLQVTNIQLQSLSDHQQQVDLIGSWRISNQVSVSSFVGVGRSTVKIGDVTANYTSDEGCPYLLTFTEAGIEGVRTGACSSTGPILDSFNTNEYVLPEFDYRANFYSLGSMVRWSNNQWTLRGGYQYQKLNRDHVDSEIVTNGGQPYTVNHIVVTDVTKKVSPHVSLLLRGQLMSNQFVGEIPFMYNQMTAHKFNRRYGLVTFGVVVNF